MFTVKPLFRCYSGNSINKLPIKVPIFYTRWFASNLSFGCHFGQNFTIYSLLRQQNFRHSPGLSELQVPTINPTDSTVCRTQPLVLIPTFPLVDSYVFQKSEHQGSDNMSYWFHCRQDCTFTTDSYVEEYCLLQTSSTDSYVFPGVGTLKFRLIQSRNLYILNKGSNNLPYIFFCYYSTVMRNF